MKTRLLIILIISIAAAFPATGELRLKPVHPDEPAMYTYSERLSLGEALASLEKVRASLASFRDLTEEAKKKVTKKKLAAIGNTDWETQHIAFFNMAGCIEGTLKKQDYLLKKAVYELAAIKFEEGTVGNDEREKARREFEEAERSFQAFWDSYGIAD